MRVPLFLIITLLLASSAQAQQPEPLNPQAADSPANPDRPVTAIFKDIAGDFGNLLSADTARVLSAGAAAAALAHTADDRVNARLAGENWAEGAFGPGRIAGYGLVQGGVATAIYFWGRSDQAPRVVHIGVDLLRAQLVTAALTYSMKVAAGRDRPDGSDGHSFPSGHSSVTFATASVLQRHFGWKGGIAYAAAGYVAMSRLSQNRHYLSDVVFGAAVGMAAGRTVTRHGRDVFTFSVAPVRGGAMVTFAPVVPAK